MHHKNNPDAYARPVFSFGNKLKRFTWQIVWTLFCSWTPIPLHSWRVFVLRCFGAKIGKSNFIYPTCKIWAPWLLSTEDVVTIASGVTIYNPGGVYIGHHSIISQEAFLCSATHDYNSPDFTYIKKAIMLEAYVWICAKATILPGVRCFEGAVLGATSTATKDLDAWMVYAGNPAIALKIRHNFHLKKKELQSQ